LKTLGDRIKAKRFEKGIMLKELAEKLGVSKFLVWQWELDRKVPTEAEQTRLIEIFGDLNEPLLANPTAE